MNFPLQLEDLRPGDVRIVEGHSGRGVQLTCSCGCINWNHLEIREATWRCRNCHRVFTHYFPGLVSKVLALGSQEAPAEAAATPDK